MSIQHILLDMDGVLSDFVTAALQLHGRIETLQNWPAGEWSMPKVLGLSRESFWSRIDEQGSEFWRQLAPYAWLDELTALVGAQAPFTILTSPSRDPHCPTGKIQWLREHISPRFNAYLIGAQKHLCAQANHVLIDDSDHNVTTFREQGGQAILFPQIWNSNHGQSDPLNYVRSELSRLNTRSNPAPSS